REHRVTIKQHLGECNVSTRVEKILAILIESGLVYCCLWVCCFFPQKEYT
ncbi:hypothetical protein BGW80DRAFT_1182662, partial [Lactifluus volemus]